MACQCLDLLDGYCRTVVEEYSTEIYKLAKAGVSPNAACFQMKLCDNMTDFLQSNSEAKSENDCALCRHVVARARLMGKEEKSQVHYCCLNYKSKLLLNESQ